MKTKTILLILAIIATTGCTTTDPFTKNARITTRKDLRTLLHENKIKIEDIIISDTCWKIPSCYDDPILAELDKEYTERTTRTELPSDNEFIEEIIAISDLREKISDHIKKNSTPWGFKAQVAYKLRGQIDTVACEISIDGKAARAYDKETKQQVTETITEITNIFGL